MKFTKEEISLCEQIAKKYRRNLKIGMYVWRKFCKSVQLIYRLDKEDKEIYTVILKGKKLNHLYWNNLKGGWLTPLWTISDCLEFLEEKGYGHIISFIHFKDGNWTFTAENSITDNYFRRTRGEKANTKLEACLKAVLEDVSNG